MPTEIELMTQVEPGFKITYTRRAIIPTGTHTLASLAVALEDAENAGTLEDYLRRQRFFEDDRLLSSCEDATVEAVNVTTTYAPVEETP